MQCEIAALGTGTADERSFLISRIECSDNQRLTTLVTKLVEAGSYLEMIIHEVLK